MDTLSWRVLMATWKVSALKTLSLTVQSSFRVVMATPTSTQEAVLHLDGETMQRLMVHVADQLRDATASQSLIQPQNQTARSTSGNSANQAAAQVGFFQLTRSSHPPRLLATARLRYWNSKCYAAGVSCHSKHSGGRLLGHCYPFSNSCSPLACMQAEGEIFHEEGKEGRLQLSKQCAQLLHRVWL